MAVTMGYVTSPFSLCSFNLSFLLRSTSSSLRLLPRTLLSIFPAKMFYTAVTMGYVTSPLSLRSFIVKKKICSINLMKLSQYYRKMC